MMTVVVCDHSGHGWVLWAGWLYWHTSVSRAVLEHFEDVSTANTCGSDRCCDNCTLRYEAFSPWLLQRWAHLINFILPSGSQHKKTQKLKHSNK